MCAVLTQHNAARSLKEIKQFVSASIQDIKKCWAVVREQAKKFTKEMSGGLVYNTGGEQYLKSFCEKLALPPPVLNAAIYISRNCKELVEGKTPLTIAATSLLIACQLHDTEKRKIEDIATIANISPETIRKCFRELHPYRSKFIPEGYTNAERIEKLGLH